MNEKIDYKKTLNLPKTDMPMKANLAEKEKDILNFWNEHDIYGRLQKSLLDKTKYILHDGPPYANGHIHMGHVLNKILKDIVVKYKQLKGYSSAFVPGWDCHGLPVEHQLFKQLKITKDEISQVAFRKKAREYALKFVDIQKEEFRRLGIFADWQHPYLTLTHKYEAQVMRAFAKLAEKGFIYRGRKPVNWCPNCETALAEAEVEYKDCKSPSIYVKFKLRDESKNKIVSKVNISQLENLKDKNFYFIIWTTTPWTLLSNIAIALNPGFKYSFVDIQDEVWILADSLIGPLMDKIGKENFHKVATLTAGLLTGLKTRHPFIKRDSVIIEADYVSSEEGTGCVHIAPGHGQDDYQAWLKYKDKYDDFNIIMPVDKKGNFDETAGKFSGLSVSRANQEIIKTLEQNNRLVYREEITHSYPHCWRCKKPIIFRATEQWFMNIDHENFREELMNNIKNEVKWIPQGAKERILSMVENRPDWCLSRQRYWGVPIPVFYCRKCKRPILDSDIIKHIADMVEKDGSDVWFEKDAKDLLPKGTKCPECSNGEFDKETDILDVWFDSGISHQAVLRKREELSYPAQLYLEGSDQHRGWFQTSLITALAIEKKPPYETVLTHGFIVDAEGKKMSKSLDNVISPKEVIDLSGADILRLWVASSDYLNDISLSETIIERLTESYRKIRNTLRFILGNLHDFNVRDDKVAYKDLFEIDKWALDKLARLYNDCLNFYDSFELHKVTRHIYNFCTVDLSSFYLDVLKDRLYTWGKNSAGRKSAQTVLYELIQILVKLIAPILSFTAEEIWFYLPSGKKQESVFLSSLKMKEDLKDWLDQDLAVKWERLLKIREFVLKALELKRSEKIIGNSLEAKVSLYTDNGQLYKLLDHYRDELASIFIVSRVNIEKADKLPEDAVKYEDVNDVAVRVEKILTSKCLRCWRYVSDVGEDEQYKDICKRCARTIREMT